MFSEKKGLFIKQQVVYYKGGFTLLLAIYGFIIASDVTVYRFLDGVDLIPHEAGHLLFKWFGEFLTVLGGTIGQLFVPVAFTIYFAARREFFSGAVALFWVGQNMFNIAVYIKDAQDMEMPLLSLGGGDSIHDWNYLLAKLGVLKFDQTIGNAAIALGIIIITVSVMAAFYFSFSEEEKESSGLVIKT